MLIVTINEGGAVKSKVGNLTDTRYQLGMQSAK
jgi:hypothetical protein